MSPRIVAAVSNALIFANPNQTVGTVVELGLAELALPVAVAVLHVAHQPRLGLAGVVLQDGVFFLGLRCTHTNTGEAGISSGRTKTYMCPTVGSSTYRPRSRRRAKSSP